MRSDDESYRVAGMVFEVSAGELAAADAYEVSDYERLREACLACARGQRCVTYDVARCANEIAACDLVAEMRLERGGLECGEAIAGGHEGLHHH